MTYEIDANTVELNFIYQSEIRSISLPPCGGGLGWGEAVARECARRLSARGTSPTARSA